MKLLSLFLVLSCWLCPRAHADYWIPPMDKALGEITDILDVRVTKMDDQGRATIEILKAYKRSEKPAKVIEGVGLSCTGGSPGTFGMKSGARYIVLLVNKDLYEERSYFPVKMVDGVAHCDLGWYASKTWLDAAEQIIPLKDFEAKMAAALDTQKLTK
jgi:hypothetical protein